MATVGLSRRHYGSWSLNFVKIATWSLTASFLRTMRQIWSGPGKAVMQSPSGRIADIVEVKAVRSGL
jgi:hypothetical protein